MSYGKVIFGLCAVQSESSLANIQSMISRESEITPVYGLAIRHSTEGFSMLKPLTHLGPVVQSIVSLTSSLRGQLVKCFTTL